MGTRISDAKSDTTPASAPGDTLAEGRVDQNLSGLDPESLDEAYFDDGRRRRERGFDASLLRQPLYVLPTRSRDTQCMPGSHRLRARQNSTDQIR